MRTHLEFWLDRLRAFTVEVALRKETWLMLEDAPAKLISPNAGEQILANEVVLILTAFVVVPRAA